MPDKRKSPIRLSLASLGQLVPPTNPGIGWVGPERPAESLADVAADPLSALFDIGRGAVTGDAPAGMNLQGLGALIAAAMPVAGGAKALRAATKAAKISELADEAAQAGIRAYHGSPHDFDKFSLEKIGTGEGAQAYGHGLYFAENENVAKEYKKALTDWEVHEPSGRVVSSAGSAKTFAGSPADRALAWVQDAASRNDISDPLRFARGNAAKALHGDADAEAILGQIDEWIKSGAKLKPGGRMYKVQIHASPDQLLDWDKPLSEQSEHVQKAMAKTGIESYRTGEEAMRTIGVNKPHSAHTAQWLKDNGIPGIRYLDGGSRAGGEGTRNFVIFDDSLVSILKKYGVALPVIEGLREKAQQGGGVVPASDVHGLVQ